MGSDLYGEHESTGKKAGAMYADCVYRIKKLLGEVKDRELTNEEKLILQLIGFTEKNLPFTWRP